VEAKRIAQSSGQHEIVVDICLHHTDEIEQAEASGRIGPAALAGTSRGPGPSSRARVFLTLKPLDHMWQANASFSVPVSTY
jgi:hypothetical protein